MPSSHAPDDHASSGGRQALLFVLITVGIDTVGLGLVLPVLPDVIRGIGHFDVSQASAAGGWLLVAYSAMQFLCGPLIGNLSDAYGRRPVLLASVAGLGIDYLVTALAPSLAWLLLGRVVAGVCGASYSTASAYVADVTETSQRGKAYGYVGAAFGLGFVIGPAVGGLLGQFGPRVPFVAAGCLSLLNLAYGWLALPETLPPEKRRAFDWRRANPLGAFKALRAYPAVLVAALVLFLIELAQTVYPALWAFSGIYRYHWSEGTVGLTLAVFGIMTAIVQAGATGPLIARIGERRTALASLAGATLVFVGYGLAPQGWMVYPLLVLGSIDGFAMPALLALMSKRVPGDAQGELQGATAGLSAVAMILGPAGMTQLFSALTGPHAPIELPGAPYFAAALLSLAATVLLATMGQRVRVEESRAGAVQAPAE